MGNERAYLVTDEASPPLFPPNTLAAYDIATLQGYESLWPRTMWHKAGYAVTSEVLTRLGVSFAIVQRAGSAGAACWQPHAPDGTRSISSNRPPLEALVGGSAPYRTENRSLPAQESGSCWPLVYRGSSFDVFGNGREAARYSSAGAHGRRVGTVTVLAETFNRRKLGVPAGAEMVRVAENWSSGWRYRVNHSAGARTIQSSDMSITAPLPSLEAASVVELEYRPADWGRWISLAACLIIIALLAGRTLDRFVNGF